MLPPELNTAGILVTHQYVRQSPLLFANVHVQSSQRQCYRCYRISHMPMICPAN
jgi:hypothetical protein